MQKALVFFTILVIIFAIPRGFDFSDEGLYVLLADPNQENIGGIFNYDLFFKLIYQLFGLEFGIVGLRILRLISYFAGAFGLAFFWKNLVEAKQLSSSLFLLALAGLFAGYGFLPPTLSYNSISVVAVCFWLAVISKKKLTWLDWLWLGLIFATLFYVKATVGLVLGLFTVIFFIIKHAFTYKDFIFLTLPLILFEGTFYFLFGENGIVRLTSEYGFLFQRADYSLLQLMKYTAVGGFWCFVVGVLFFIAARSKGMGFRFYPLLLSLGIAALCMVFYFTRITSEWSHFLILATFSAINWQVGGGSLDDLSKKEKFFTLILILLPFFLHFGSNVYWMRLGIHYWVFWILALLILLKDRSAQFKYRINSATAFCSFIVVVFGVWIAPFEGEYLWKASEIWEYQAGKEIKLSKKQVTFLNVIQTEIGDSEATSIISLYSNPGILYLLDMNSPFSPAYWKSSQVNLFLQNGNSIDLLLFNELEPFPFERSDWALKKELTQPNGEKLLILWKK